MSPLTNAHEAHYSVVSCLILQGKQGKNLVMKYFWDPRKAKSNLKKHRISFELALTVFDDPHHLSSLDTDAGEEERWVTIGVAADCLTLIVIHTYFQGEGDEVIRIISARKATRAERRQYEEGI